MGEPAAEGGGVGARPGFRSAPGFVYNGGMSTAAATEATTTKLSADEYLEIEQRSEVRHEFYDGVMVAMVGVRLAHSVVVGNLVAAVRTHLRGRPCRVHAGEFKVHIADANVFVYPDMVVECMSEPEPGMLYTAEPKLVVEVLSPSTRDHDRGAKFALYRRSPSLQEFVLVDAEQRVVERFYRGDEGVWSIGERLADAGEIELTSIGLRLDLEAIYEDSLVPDAEPLGGAEPVPKA